jgi:hypothetical protein
MDRVRTLFDRQLEDFMDVGVDLIVAETFTWLGETLIATGGRAEQAFP